MVNMQTRPDPLLPDGNHLAHFPGAGNESAQRRTETEHMSGSAIRRRRWTPNTRRVAEKPNPADWGMDEPLTLYEAVALLWPNGPVKVATLRAEIHAGRLPYRRIGKAFCVTREGLATLGQCALKGAPDGGRASVKSLLARHRSARAGIPGSGPEASRASATTHRAPANLLREASRT